MDAAVFVVKGAAAARSWEGAWIRERRDVGQIKVPHPRQVRTARQAKVGPTDVPVEANVAVAARVLKDFAVGRHVLHSVR